MVNSANSPTLSKYAETMKECIQLYYPEIPANDIYNAINYSIEKRMKNSPAQISNSYKRYRNQNGEYQDVIQNTTLQAVSDYILSRQPIVTAFGTMFMHHEVVPNPLVQVVEMFLANRSKHKKQMFQYPKGSEEFEKYNLLQSLTI